MFNYQIDESFNKYIKDINPDVAIIQECRYKRLSNLDRQYEILLPNNFTQDSIKNTYHLTVAFSRYHLVKENKDSLKKYDRTFLNMRINGTNNITAVHIPLKDKESEKEYNNLLDAIEKSNSEIICGDFNASIKKEDSPNYKFLRKLIDEQGYFDLWSKGLSANKSYYINYKGEELKAEEGKLYRTYVGNTHIDYILGKEKLVNFNKIIIDTRTLSFTDHCSVIAEVEFVNKID